MPAQPLNPRVFRALAHPGRAAALRALAARPHTPAELARRLDVPESTVRGHLRALVAAGLVRRREDGRVWAYHEPTDAGRAVVAGTWQGPVVTGFAGALVAAAGLALVALAERTRPARGPGGAPALPAPPVGAEPPLLPPDVAATLYLVAGLVLAAAGLALVIVARRAARAAALPAA